MHITKKAIRWGALAALLGLAGAAQATLVTNGGFETGNLSGWSPFGNTGFTGTATGVHAQSGSYGAYFGPVGSTGGIFQTLATEAGQSYDVSFWLRADPNTPNSFAFDWDGGVDEMVITNTPGFAYQQFSFTLTASSALTDLRFVFQHNPAYYSLDNVVVTAAVPEPATLALAGLALLGAVAAGRKSGPRA
jgi:hypothetical protein